MSKITYNSLKAPAAIGPYSQATEYNGLIFISGQIPINRETGELISGDIAKETEQVMKNLNFILLEAGLSFDHVMKTTIFMKDMNDYAIINEVYASFLNEPYPAREAVQVSVLPKNVNVEISMIASRF